MSKSYNSIKAGWVNPNADSMGRRKDYRDIKASDYDFGVDDSYIKSFLDDSSSYLQQAGSESSNVNYKNASSEYDNKRSQWSSLSDRANTIRGFYNANRSRIGEDSYNQMMNYLDSFDRGSSDVLDYYRKNKRFFSQWETEDDYNKSVEASKKQEEMRTADLDSVGVELSDLDSQIEAAKKKKKSYDDEYKKNGGYIYTPSNNTRVTPEQFAQYTAWSKQSDQYQKEIDELEKKRSQRGLYYNQAKNLQQEDRLTNEARQAEDFDKYVMAGATMENPTLKEAERIFGGKEIVNPVTYAREHKEEYASTNLNGNVDRFKTINPLYFLMKDEEVETYNYYLGKGDRKNADLYLKSIEEKLNSREANNTYDLVKDNMALEYAFGVWAGLDQFSSGMKSLFNTEDEYIPASPVQITSGMVRENLTDKGPEILGNSLGQAGYDFITTTSNMMPSIITSAVVGSVATPAVGAKVGTAIAGASGSTLLGASASGNAYQEMLNYGYDKGQARAYSALVGASEAGLQYVLGGIGSLGRGADGLFGGVTEQLLKRVDHVLARAAIQLGGNMLSEGSEEYLQDILEPWFRNLVFKEDNEIKLLSEEAMYSGLLGALSAGAFEGRKTINSELNIYRDGKYINKHGNTGALVDESLKLDANSLAYEIAEKAQAQIESKGKAKNGTVGKLFNEYASQSFVDDVAGRVNALGVKGAENLQEQLQNKSTLTNAIVNTVRGNKLTSTESAVFDANKETANRIISEIDNFGKEGYTNQWLNESYINKRIITGDKGVFDKSGNTMSVSRDGKTKPVSNERIELGRTFDVDVSDRLSDDGKTRTVDGKEITIDQSNPYAVSEDGKTYLNTNEGKVALEDVSFGTESEGLIYEAFAGMDTNIANLAVSRYHGQTPVRTYITGMLQGINVYGKYNFKGVGIDISKSSFLADLSDADQQYALRLGRMLADIETKSKQEVVKKSLTAAKDVKHQGKGTVRFEKGVSAKSDIQRKGVELAKQLSKAMGVNIVFFDSTKDAKHKGDNGWFDKSDNSIHIDINAGNNLEGTIAFTLGHELTHFIEKWSPKKYKAFSDFLLEQYGEHGKSVQEMLETKMAELKTDDVDEAMSELVADACQTMLLDSNAMEKLAQLRAQDRTLWDKIKEFVNKLLTDIKQLYKEYQPDSSEAKALREMEDVVGKISAMFEDAAVDAVENYNASQRNNTAQESATRYSIRENYEKDFDDWFNSTTREQRLKSGGFIRIGNTPDVLKKLGVPNGVFQMGKAKVQKILDKHSEMTPEFIKLVPRMVENPILIMDSRTVKNSFVVYGEMLTDDGHPIMASVLVTKTNAGTTATDVTVITSNYARSAGKVDNSNDQYLIDNSKIRYVNPDMKKTNNWLQSLRLQLPSDITNYGFIDRISQNQQNATGNIQKSQKRDNLYIAAIEKGDIQTAQNLVDEAAKNAGYTIKAYHGTTNQEEKRTWNDKLKIWDSEYKPFTVFKSQYPEQTGHFFSSHMDNAGGYGSNIYNVYLKFENPFVIDCKGQNYANISFRGKEMDTYEWARYAKKSGYDGVIFENISDGVGYDDLSRVTTDYVAFNSSQIKSADTVTYDNNGNVIPLSKRFSYMVDIRYSHRKDNRHVADRLTESEWRYFKEQIGHLKAGNQYEISANGDIMIPVDNKLVYTDGKYSNPGISKIIEIDSKYESEIDYVRRLIYEVEKGKSKVEDAYKIGEYIVGQGNIHEYAVGDGRTISGYDRRTERGKSKSDTYHREFLQDRIRNANEAIRKASSEGDEGVSQEQYSKRTISNRELLADALESTIDTSTVAGQYEAKYLKDYQENIVRLDELEEHLQEVSAELKELSFAPGKRDMTKIRDLRDEKIKTQNRIGIYDKKLLKLEATKPLQALLTREKDKVRKYYQEQGRERLNNYINRKSATVLRARIKRISNDFQHRLLHGTDTKYIPVSLVNGVIDVCNAIDPTGKRQDTKVAEKYRTGREALANLKMQYDGLKGEDVSYDFSSEFNEEFSSLIGQLAQEVGDTPLRDMSRDQLEDVHDIISDISHMIKDATKQIGTSERISNYEAGQEVIATMQRMKLLGGMEQGKIPSFFRNWMDNPMRAVREMSGFDENSRLVKLFDELNAGRRKADTFRMEAEKPFERLRGTKEGLKAYSEAVEKPVDFGLVDVNGNPFQISKMQAMTAVLTWRREQANVNRRHLETPVLFPDMELERKGKFSEAFDKKHEVRIGEIAVNRIMDSLSEWDKQYLELASDLFNKKAKDAVNEVMLKIRHRIVATEKAYIPYTVNQDYIPKESDNVKFDATIEGMGILKSVQRNASQQLVIRGLNTVLDDHIGKVAKIYGLAIPVRNWKKVFNTKQTADDGGMPVRKAIREVWNSGGVKLLDRAVADLQSPRKSDSFLPLSYVKSAFVASTLNGNISVWMKQAASYPTAGAILSNASLVKGLADYSTKIKDGIHAQDVWDEIDAYTSQHWIRRQGLSLQELGELTQSKGWQNKIDHKLGVLSPMKWIQAMDVGTTAALWYACKDEVRRNGTSTEAADYWDKVTKLYDQVIEETQPMYDSLHRAEITKNEKAKDIFMFQTQPLQNSGILREGAMEYLVAKREFGAHSDIAKQKFAKFRKAVVSQFVSHFVFTSMTLLANALLHRMNSWKDDEDEVTWEGILPTFAMQFLENYFGAILPIVGTSGISLGKKLFGDSSYDVLSYSTLDKINDTFDVLHRALDEPSFDTILNAGCELATYFKIPAKNAKNIINGAILHVEDIINGEFLSFHAGSYTSEAETYRRYIKAGEAGKASAFYEDWLESKKAKIISDRKADGKTELTDEELEKKAKSSIKSSVSSKYRKDYVEAYKNKDEALMQKIKGYMERTGLYKNVSDTCSNWLEEYK